MDAGIISGIVLAFVGIIKLPFKKFKANHPKVYRFTFYFLSLALAVGLPVLTQLYLVESSLWSVEFLVMTVSTVALVFGGYSTYENTALKTLVKKIADSIKALGQKHSESKVVKDVERLVDKFGVEKINQIICSIPEKTQETENKQ